MPSDNTAEGHLRANMASRVVAFLSCRILSRASDKKCPVHCRRRLHQAGSAWIHSRVSLSASASARQAAQLHSQPFAGVHWSQVPYDLEEVEVCGKYGYAVGLTTIFSNLYALYYLFIGCRYIKKKTLSTLLTTHPYACVRPARQRLAKANAWLFLVRGTCRFYPVRLLNAPRFGKCTQNIDMVWQN
jgi:hypothetical protein